MAGIPVLFFGFADQEDRHLSFLRTELANIQKELEIPIRKQQIIPVLRRRVAVQDLRAELPNYKDNLLVFHYAGHANNTSLELTDQFLNAQSLATFFELYKNLKLVFLNGCSTRDQVEAFLESGAKAVIATSAPISDKRATDFAIEFYRELKNGNKLLLAYQSAINSIRLLGESIREPLAVDGNEINLEGEAVTIEKLSIPKEDATEEKVAFQLLDTPLKVRGQGLMGFGKLIPWGLYYKNEDILDWMLADDFPISNNGARQSAQQMKEAEIAQLETLLERINNELLALQAQGDTANSQRERLLFKKNKLEKKLSKANKFLTQLTSGDEALICNAINQINYKDQIEFFSTWKPKKQVGAFLIQGTPNCGHRFLVEEVAPKEVLNFAKDHFQPFFVNFEVINQANSFDEATLWNNLAMDMRIRRFTPANVKVKVADEIKDILKKQHVVLIFDGVNHLVAKAIKSFWENLLLTLVPNANEKSIQLAFPNRLLLLLLDKDAEITLDPGKHEWLASSNPKFKQIFSEDSAQGIALRPEILKPIAPIKEDEFLSWFYENDFPDGIFLDDNDLEEILTASNGYVLPLIEKFCEKIGKVSLYDDFYDQFTYETE